MDSAHHSEDFLAGATSENGYRCSRCQFIFARKDHYVRHLQSSKCWSRQTLYQCNACDASFPRKDALERHKRGKHPLACEFCEERFSSVESMRVHRRAHLAAKRKQRALAKRPRAEITKYIPEVKIRLNDSYKIYPAMCRIRKGKSYPAVYIKYVYIKKGPRTPTSSVHRFNFPLRLAPTFLEAMRRLDNGGGFRKLPLAVDQYPKDTDGYFVLPCAKTNFSRTRYGIEQFTLQVREETFLTNNGKGSYEALVFTSKSEHICVPIQLFYSVYASLTYICQKSAM